jgi:hypothetical protein
MSWGCSGPSTPKEQQVLGPLIGSSPREVEQSGDWDRALTMRPLGDPKDHGVELGAQSGVTGDGQGGMCPQKLSHRGRESRWHG